MLEPDEAVGTPVANNNGHILDVCCHTPHIVCTILDFKYESAVLLCHGGGVSDKLLKFLMEVRLNVEDFVSVDGVSVSRAEVIFNVVENHVDRALTCPVAIFKRTT